MSTLRTRVEKLERQCGAGEDHQRVTQIVIVPVAPEGSKGEPFVYWTHPAHRDEKVEAVHVA